MGHSLVELAFTPHPVYVLDAPEDEITDTATISSPWQAM
jgi:hypothetical protein